MKKRVDLTKRQVADLMELMCPNCRKEVLEISRNEYHCNHCSAHYLNNLEEEKRGGNATGN